MTANQIAYQNMLTNRASQHETARSNAAKERETHRSNVAKETETNRSNVVSEIERQRSNLENERQGRVALWWKGVDSVTKGIKNLGSTFKDGVGGIAGIMKMLG